MILAGQRSRLKTDVFRTWPLLMAGSIGVPMALRSDPFDRKVPEDRHGDCTDSLFQAYHTIAIHMYLKAQGAAQEDENKPE